MSRHKCDDSYIIDRPQVIWNERLLNIAHQYNKSITLQLRNKPVSTKLGQTSQMTFLNSSLYNFDCTFIILKLVVYQVVH